MLVSAPKVEMVEIPNEGFVSLIGRRITVFCNVYIYTGELIGVNSEFIKLSNAGIVYETGEFNSKSWKDMQSLPNDLYIMKDLIESFCILK